MITLCAGFGLLDSLQCLRIEIKKNIRCKRWVTHLNLINVAAAIIEKDGLVLAARRKPGGHMAGLWEFPGGKIEPGETPQQCLIRELQEEFTITASVGQMVGESVYHYQSTSIRLLAYRAVHVAGEFELLDHDKLIWLVPEQLDQLEWAPADIPLVKTYQTQLQTTRFYQHNADAYAAETIALPMTKNRDDFAQYLMTGSHILDLGCGAGRDSKAFIDAGFAVTAVDGCAELAQAAAIYIDQPVEVLQFAELAYDAVFDGVWACASLLHCDKTQIKPVLGNVINALKPGGVAYLSFKWGDDELTDEKGRYFNNYTADSLKQLMASFETVDITKTWTETVPLRNAQQRWLNLFFKKDNV
jgi:mutator protein MutT